MQSATWKKRWEEIGARDPYFGVFGNPHFQREQLTQKRRDAFFALGAAHVDWIQTVLERHFNRTAPFGRVLDYGCGVGRMAFAFASRAQEVVGIDLAPAMIAEAKSQAERLHATNVRFALVADMAEVCNGNFDLVHSYITFQHIPRQLGMQIAQQLIDRLTPTGVGILHFTYQRNASLPMRTRLSLGLRHRAPWLAALVRKLRSPRALPATMINSYSLQEIMSWLYANGVRESYVQLTNLGLYAAVIVFFRRSDQAATPAHLLAPQNIDVP